MDTSDSIVAGTSGFELVGVMADMNMAVFISKNETERR